MFTVLRQVTPQSSLLEGGTRLTVEGTNLGYRVNQVQVTVIGQPCPLVESDYIVSVRLDCFYNNITVYICCHF